MAAAKPPKPELARAIVKASRNLEQARDEWELALVAALKAGASSRLVAEVAGVAMNTVIAIGKKHGWPDASEKKRRRDEAESRRLWRDEINRQIDDL